MSRFRKSAAAQPTEGIVGPVRFARRDSDLAGLQPGDIALVELPDIDSRHAHDLVERRVAAVLNAADSSSGRLPNQGPSILAHAGIALLDVEDEGIWSRLRNGETVQVDQSAVLRDGVVVASGVTHDAERAKSQLEQAGEGLATRLDSLAANATDHIQREQAMLLDGARVPRLRTDIADRPVVVVTRAYDAKDDLAGLKRYIAEKHPVLVGAGSGADVLLDAGYTPDLLVGELDGLSDRAIRTSGEVVVTTATGRVDRPERLERHGKEVVTYTSTGSDDDLAILLADTNDASVIVHVGAPPTLTEFLERAPSDVARMFVARLRAGSKIVDAKSVRALSVRTSSWWPAVLMVLAGLVAVGVAIGVTPLGQEWTTDVRDAVDQMFSSIGGLLP